MTSTALVSPEECLLHDQGRGHPERPERLEAVMEGLRSSGLNLVRLPAQKVRRKELLWVHTAEHVATIENTCIKGLHYPDPDTQMMAASWAAALLAAGSGIVACQAVLDGQVNNAFCAVRPPGHHAEADHAMGFCLFNNIAIAARWLQNEAGIGRVAIVDWDVHHGNGTQHTFYEDENVYYCSLHQHPLYPGTGKPDERGKNRSNLNIQMNWGQGSEAWLDAVERQVLPELERFNPEFLLISAGFDAHKLDPLGAQQVESDAYGEMTRLLRPAASGRIVSFLEGGYNLEGLREGAVSHVRALAQ